MTALTIELGWETETRLAELVKNTGKTVNETIAQAINRLCDQSDAQIYLPGQPGVPNAATLESFAQMERGEFTVSHSVEEFLAQLNADD
ncbi:MAG: hypothetical protein QM537_01150 [Candidatus Symbiobacter sp.]|nr:hypothetical protein [Candidatus Symbiobacter sp.]